MGFDLSKSHMGFLIHMCTDTECRPYGISRDRAFAFLQFMIEHDCKPCDM